MKLGTEVVLGPGHIVLDWVPAPLLKGAQPLPIFGHVCCGNTSGWIKMPLGTEIGLGSGDIVLDGDWGLSYQRGTACQFSPHVCCMAKRLY